MLRCLQAAPEQRYASADQLYEDLQAQLAHRPLVHQVEPSARERLSKWKARHPAICSASTVVACALILLISTLVGWYYQYRKTLVAHAQQRAQILQDLVVPLSISLGTMERDEALPTLLDVQPRIVNFVDPQELTPDRNWFNRLDKSTSNQVKANGQLLLRMIESSQILAPRSAPGSDPTKADLPNELRQPIRDLISRLTELLPSKRSKLAMPQSMRSSNVS